MNQVDEPPRVDYLPQFGGIGAPARRVLKCEFGWDHNTTAQFLSNELDDLYLRVMEHQVMQVPALGAKATGIERLMLQGPGVITGIEQFTAVDMLSVDTYPRNGVDFAAFPRLRHVSTSWEPKFSERLFECRGLRGLHLTEGFNSEDCLPLRRLEELRDVSFIYGRLKRLTGLEYMAKLESIGLAYARHFVELGNLENFPNLLALSLASLPKLEWDGKLAACKALRQIDFEALPALTGTLELGGLPHLEKIRVVKCPNVVVDLNSLSAMPNLEMLFLNAPHVNLNLDDLFSRMNLRLFAVMIIDELTLFDDDALYALAARHGRSIKRMERVGPKKFPQLSLTFEVDKHRSAGTPG